jgi:hypothetical protein
MVEPRLGVPASPADRGEDLPVRVEISGREPFGQRVAMAEPPRRYTLDTRDLEFATPLELVGLAALLAQGKALRRRTRLIMPIDTDACTYLERMDVVDLAERFGAQVEGAKCAGPRHVRSLIETQQVRATDDKDRICDLLHAMALANGDSSVAAAAVEIAGELIDNGLTHSESRFGCFFAAQHYTGETTHRPRVEFAIADAGVGILDHLRRNRRFKNLEFSDRAILKALKRKVSGADDPEGTRGNGLPDILDAGAKGGGRLLMRSGNGVARVDFGSGDPPKAHRSGHPTPGTWALVQLDLPRRLR